MEAEIVNSALVLLEAAVVVGLALGVVVVLLTALLDGMIPNSAALVLNVKSVC